MFLAPTTRLRAPRVRRRELSPDNDEEADAPGAAYRGCPMIVPSGSQVPELSANTPGPTVTERNQMPVTGS